MEIKKIIVDELPSVCDKCELAENFDIFDRKGCVATKRFLRNPSKERPDWCPLEVEEVCEWSYRYYDDDGQRHLYRSSCSDEIEITEYKEADYCPSCGKRIKYVESVSSVEEE